MPDFSFEAMAWDKGAKHVCGVDEAGRGPLAGPVVAAAVVLDPERIPDGLDDSKKLSQSRRVQLFDEISCTAGVGVGICSVDEIDLLNILGATMQAMARAVSNLPQKADHALIDGNRMPMLICDGDAIVKGDARSLSIAAASVIAKVTRDRIMATLATKHPGYGWERNAGYGTAEHLAALKHLGPTPHHRRSFAPVRDVLTAT